MSKHTLFSNFLNGVIVILLTRISTAITQQNCLCKFDNASCLPIVQSDVTFYDLYTDENTKTSGIIQCWDVPFTLDGVSIIKCNKGDRYHDDIHSRSYKEAEFGIHHAHFQHSDNVTSHGFITICVLQDGEKLNQNSSAENYFQHIRRLNRHHEIKLLTFDSVDINFHEHGLDDFASLEHLHLINVTLNKLSSNFLPPHGKLKRLQLSDNNIEELPSEIFIRNRELNVIEVNNNPIKFLELCTKNTTSNYLKNLPNVFILSLTHNRISQICYDFFKYSTHLRYINLSYNNLMTIERVFFRNVTYISFLDLSHNKLEFVTESDFMFLHELDYLNLSSNHINVIEKLSFRNLYRLKELSLDDNLLEFKDNSAPYFPNNIQILMIKNNYLQTIPYENLENLHRLQTLNLSGNHISYIRLQELFHKFQGHGLKEVDLQDNLVLTFDLQEINYKGYFFSVNTPQLSWHVKFYLGKNPLRCDCSAKKLRHFATALFISSESFSAELETNNLYCNEPKEFQSMLLNDIDEEFLRCEHPLICPANCTCSAQHNETVVNCGNSNYSTIPLNMPANATSLIISSNPVTNLQNLNLWHSLHTLHLDNCSAIEIALNAEISPFESLTNLKFLSIESGNVTMLQWDVFKNLSNLRTLKLDHNSITTMPGGLLLSLIRLKEFHVSNNNIKNLSKEMFESNVFLETVRLCCNTLSNIQLNMSRLNRLQFVDLSYNLLHSIGITWPNNVREILLSHNRVEFVDFSDFPTGIHYLDLSYNRLVYVNVDEIQYFNQGLILDVSNNAIISVYSQMNSEISFSSPVTQEVTMLLQNNPFSCDCRIKSFISYLEVARESNAITKYIFEIDELFCASPAFMKGNRISHLMMATLPCEHDKCVTNCTCYKQLYSDYQIIQCLNIPSNVLDFTVNEMHVTNASFINLSKLLLPKWHSLYKISIRKFVDLNVHLTEQYFSEMKNLSSLILTEFRGLQFESSVFSNLTEIFYLDLSSNGITELPPFAFNGNIKLKYLKLSNNLLHDVPSNSFYQLTDLQFLDVSNNELTNLDRALFTHLELLESLYVQNNKLNYLPPDILLHCNFLKVVDLSHNLLTSSALHFLSIPTSVTYLNLSQNKLASVEDNWQNLLELKILDLSFNQISIQNLTQLTYFPKSCKIFLQSNRISNVLWSGGIQESLKETSYIDSLEDGFISIAIANNPFICDCNLKNFIQFLRDNDEMSVRLIDKQELKCANPSNLNNTLLQDVKDKDLYCNLTNCPWGCICKHVSLGDVNIVNCNTSIDTSMDICPQNVNTLMLSGEYNLEFLKSICWTGIRSLQITNNSFTQNIPDDTLHKHFFLQKLNLAANGLTTVPQRILWFLSNLTEIDFSKNSLEYIPNMLFANLKNLVKLDFSFNRLWKINWQIPTSVQYLNLAQNEINSFNVPKLNQHYQIKTLNLSHNKLHLIETDASFLYHLKYLQLIDLSYNKIFINCYNISSIFPLSLHSLNMSHNNLHCTYLWGNKSSPTVKLRHIDFSYNPIEKLQLNDFIFSNNSHLSISLRYCKISNYSFVVDKMKAQQKMLFTFDVTDNNNIECDCDISLHQIPRHYEQLNSSFNLQVITMNKCTASKFRISLYSENIFELTPDVIVCAVKYNCPSNCSCLKANDTVNMYCIQKHFQSLPVLIPFNIHFVNFDFNNVTLLQGLSHPNWNRVIGFSVRYNMISELSNENFSSLTNLREFHLDGNQLLVPSGWLQNFVLNNYLSFHVTLSGNPWSCECENILFQKWLVKHATILIDDALNITCNNGNLLLNFDLCPINSMIFWKVGLPIILICIVIIGLLLLVVFYYRKKNLVLAWIYGKNVCGWCVSEEEIDDDKDYDAFLSYCEEDTQFAIRELLPGLENNKPFYKICIHERDWIAGHPILEQIESSVINSRRVIIVLSQHYVQSMWANAEFKFAHYYSIKDKISRIIVIVLNEDFVIDDLDPEFQAYLRMNTYLKATDTQFWTKLRYVMPHKSMTKRNVNFNRRMSALELVQAEDEV